MPSLERRTSTTLDHFDYVIVGAGSAGCVLANRLSAGADCRVLLIEAGDDAEPFWVRTPAGLPFLFQDPRLNWQFSTQPEINLDGRKIYWPRGKILGGSSAINGMLHVRGNAHDYDDWAAAGNGGWSYSDVLPYFKRLEDNIAGADPWRGRGGPLPITRHRVQHPITRHFVDAVAAAGILLNPDFNGQRQEGVGYSQHTIVDGIRMSAARAFLGPARRRKNLVIRDRCFAHRILVSNGEAKGIVFERDGKLFKVAASRETIICGGTIASPQLLMLSGIGAAEELSANGIPVHANLPGVGKNLQDHFVINLGYEVRGGMSMNAMLSGWRKYAQAARYVVTRGGPLAMGASHAQAFVRSQPWSRRPDMQISFRPWSFTFERAALRVHPFPGVQFAALHLYPKSRGSIALRGPDPRGAPAIMPNYLSHEADVRATIAALKFVRMLAAKSPLREFIVRENVPGTRVQLDTELRAFLRSSGQSMYHPVGTCKMGLGRDAVVDPRLCVRGVRRLRVVDASVMPSLIGGNTNGPTMMIAEKAADMILADHAVAGASHN
jgi:choline dehydrogenase